MARNRVELTYLRSISACRRISVFASKVANIRSRKTRTSILPRPVSGGQRILNTQLEDQVLLFGRHLSPSADDITSLQTVKRCTVRKELRVSGEIDAHAVLTKLRC